MIKRPYQSGIAVYQLAKFRPFEFHYDFIDKYLNRQDFELCSMDADSFYLVTHGDSFDEIAKPGLRLRCEFDKRKFDMRQRNLAREELSCLNRNLLIKEKCSLLLSAICW